MSGAGGSIFMDIESRLEQSSFGAVINGITSRMSQVGKDTGTAFGRDFGAGVTASSAQMTAALEKNMQAAQVAVEKSMEGMVLAQNKLVTSAGKVEAAQLRVNEITQRYGAESSQAVTATNNLTRAQQDQATASRNATRATTEQTAASTELTAATRRQQEALDSTAASSVAFGGAMNKAGLFLTAGFALAVGESINKAGDFEQSQTRLVTSAGESASQLKTVSDGILQMAGAVGFSAQQLSAGMYTIESAGYHGADGLTVLKAAAQGSKNENADLKETTEAVTTALHDYHMGADQAALVMSKMQVAVSQGKTTLQDFAGSLHSVQPIAAAAGISIDDLYGTLAAMTASGESADQATQHMADAIRHLSNPTTQMTEELSQLGINSADVQQHLGQRGLAGSMQAISDAITQKMGPAGTLAVSAFNQSQIAARDAQVAFDHLPPAVQGVATAVKNGTLSFADYRKTGGGLAVEQKSQLDQWLSLDKRVTGFSAAIKSGKSDIQTYQSAMALATGDMSSMDVALMVGGENAQKTSENIKMVAATTVNADGSVKGWEETQNTFNQRMSEFKASIGATAIEIGTNFLPAATDAAKVLGDVGNWLSQNKGFLDALIISIGIAVAGFLTFKVVSAMWAVMNIGIEAASAAMALFTVAEEGATVGAGGLAAALAATGISEIVLGITALVAVVAGLVVGVKYAYEHWGWFKTAVDDTWHVLKGVGEWIGGVFMAAWHGITAAVEPVEHAFGNVAHAFSNVEHAGGNVVHAFENVMNVLKYIGAIIVTVIAIPFVLAYKLIEAATKFVWESVIQPIFGAIAAIFHWLYDHGVQPVIDLVVAAFHVWGEIFHWLHDTIIEPIINRISDIWHWLYDNAIHPIVDLIKADIHAWGEVFSWVHDSVIKPIGDQIGTVMNGIKDAFKGCVDWIETQWGRIVGIVGPPVKFIVDSVYNEAIVPVWNDVAGVFGLSKLEPVGGGLGAATGAGNGSVPVSALAATHAGGGVWQGAGVLPGYAPGKDIHNAILSPGEGVAVPELVQAIGPSNFMALNYAYSGGRKPGSGPGFDAGGVIGGIGNVIGNVVGGAEKAVKTEFDMAKFMAKLTADPVGAVKDVFSDALGKTAGTPGAPSAWLDMAKGIPGKFIDAVIDKAKNFLSLGGAGGTPFTGSPDLMGWIAQAEAITGVGPSWTGGLKTLIGRESGGNPNAQNNDDINAKNGDPSRGLMQTIGSTFERYRSNSLPDNIFDPVANIVAGINYIKARYGGIENVQQANPALPPQGYAGGGIVGYAGGGVAPPADRSAIDRALGWARSLEGHPYNDQGWLDCSGMASGVYNELLGRPLARAFTTVSDFLALGFKKGTGGVFDIGVTPKPGAAGHMAMTLDGHNIESGGAHNNIAVDGAAAGSNDGQFSDHYYLPGSLFSPPYKGAGATPNATSNSQDKLNADVTKWTKAAEKATELAKTETEAATKHDQAAAKHLADAAASDALAAKSIGAAKQKHVDAANKSREEADTSKKAAQKSRDEAAKHTQEAQDDQAKAAQAKTDASSVGSSQKPLTGTGSGTGSNSNGPVQPMTLHDFGSRLGGIAADSFTETFGLSNTVIADPSKSAFFRIGSALAGAKWGQYQTPEQQKQAQTPQAKDIADPEQPDVSLYDDGGWLMPGLNLNLTKKPEPVLAPREKDNLEAIAKGGGSGMRAMVLIENQHVNGGDGRAVARDIYREMLAYPGAGRR